MVDWKGGGVMAATALIAAPLGAMTSGYVPVQTLKMLFAVMVLAAALRTLWTSRLPEPNKMMSLKKRMHPTNYRSAFKVLRVEIS
ncbi:MAG: sulfite exporter TauE/SafE family protein, partial [Balneolaceae bacterium]